MYDPPGATKAAPWDQICRQAHLLWSWWGIGHPGKKFETSIKVFSCYRGYWVFPFVGMSREKEQSKISVPLWKIGCIGADIQPHLQRAQGRERSGSLD